MKLTKEEALIACADIWNWLAIDSTQWKTVAIEKLNFTGMFDQECPCCEYTYGEDKGCDDCPLISVWPNGCTDSDSPYLKWNGTASGDGDINVENAIMIRDAAISELEKLWAE